MSGRRRVFVIPKVGGCLEALVQRDGRIDVSLISPEGPSAAVYMEDVEIVDFAISVLALIPMESGLELGEAIEERRQMEAAG